MTKKKHKRTSKKKSRRNYHPFSKDKKKRQIYWKIMLALMVGTKKRKIAKKYKVSMKTVNKVKTDMINLKNVGWFTVIYLVTISSYKLVSWYVSNSGLQFLVSGAMTSAIVMLSYREITNSSY